MKKEVSLLILSACTSRIVFPSKDIGPRVRTIRNMLTAEILTAAGVLYSQQAVCL